MTVLINLENFCRISSMEKKIQELGDCFDHFDIMTWEPAIQMGFCMRNLDFIYVANSCIKVWGYE